ncbi:MAG TPA: hypothetical protein PKA82_07010 [Pyrinomonadaceae bacterium]|nr:hypothetical protein [Pyrinomonadaceae bacterium]
MARAHSFEITVSNNKTEKLGIDYLIANETGFFYADKDTRKQILNLLDLPLGFARAFDMIYIPRYVGTFVTDEVIAANIDEIILVELKTTKKYLPENPKGFFFGATENEFNFGKLLGDKFRFCFVSLHERGSSHSLLTIDELEARIRTKRIQYQINL